LPGHALAGKIRGATSKPRDRKDGWRGRLLQEFRDFWHTGQAGGPATTAAALAVLALLIWCFLRFFATPVAPP
jgi:hypothetical protein